MISVSADFKTIRDKDHPDPIIKKITLTEYNVNGVKIQSHDISSSLIRGLPEIKKELGEKLDKSMADSITLSFLDTDNSIYDILMKSDRYLGIKVELTFDKPNLKAADNAIVEQEPESLTFSPDGKYLFVGSIHLGNRKLQKYSVDSDGNLTFIKKTATTWSFYDLYATADYIYCGNATHRFQIYDYDLNLISETNTGNTGGNIRICVSDNELHAWTADPWYNKVCYLDISDKAVPVSYDAVTNIDAYNVVYFDNKIFVVDDAVEKLKVYDASTPNSVPYNLIKELDLSSTNLKEIYLDSERAILYISGSALEIIDISDTSNPVITAYSDTVGECGYPVVKEDRFLYMHKAGSNKINVVNSINHYLIKAYSDYDAVTTTGKELVWNGDNVLAYCDKGTDKVYTITIRQDWINYFEGLVQIETIDREGRNVTFFMAISAEKELEKYSAEGVCDTNINPLAGTGLNFISADGGFCGAHTLKYIRQNSSHYLQYDNGKIEQFTATVNVTLWDEAEQQEVVISVDSMSDLPDETTEYTIVLKYIDGNSWTSSDMGYWYEYMSIEDMIGLLLDVSVFSITDRKIRITE